MANKKIGTCLLTGKTDKLVKCHILPQAFTRPAINGEPLLQSTKGEGHRRRWTSWYDASLVARAGEDILSAIDDVAIKELRRAKLVWSGWGIVPPVFEPIGPYLPDHGLRTVKKINQEAIWRFFWSIAWRASVSQIADMKYFQLPEEVEVMARDAILKQRTSCLELPVSLIQLSTKGEAHNHSPSLIRNYNQVQMAKTRSRYLSLEFT